MAGHRRVRRRTRSCQRRGRLHPTGHRQSVGHACRHVCRHHSRHAGGHAMHIGMGVCADKYVRHMFRHVRSTCVRHRCNSRTVAAAHTRIAPSHRILQPTAPWAHTPMPPPAVAAGRGSTRPEWSLTILCGQARRTKVSRESRSASFRRKSDR